MLSRQLKRAGTMPTICGCYITHINMIQKMSQLTSRDYNYWKKYENCMSNKNLYSVQREILS